MAEAQTARQASDWLPFSGFGGHSVRIAVIDSGIFPGHPHIDAARIIGGCAVGRDGSIDTDSAAMIDRLGHGTAVAAAIQEKARQADYLAVRVFQDGLRASAAALVAAIDWSVAAGADIINLSLGTANAAHAPLLAAAAERAAQTGSILLAARETADGEPCWPGALPGVIGVGLDWECPRSSYRAETRGGHPGFLAPGYPRPIPGVPERRNLHGISFAVANMTGFAACAWERLAMNSRTAPSLDAICSALVAEIG